MLGFFPKIHVDELMYSVFARYHVQSGNTAIKFTTVDLFGNKSAYSVADFPTNLGYLYERIKHFNGSDVSEWINKHSMYNYYTNFVPLELKRTIYHLMINDARDTSIKTKIGLTISTIKPFSYFRYCSQCVNEDMEQYGETYWRMTQQLPSSFYCLKHDELLIESDVLIRGINNHEFIQATPDNCKNTKSSIMVTDKTKYWLKVIAEETRKLATISFGFDIKALVSKYHTILQVKGYKTPKGRTDQLRLCEDFEKLFGKEVLSLLQSKVNYENDNCWLKGLVRKHRSSFHPIRHMLIILFLGETIDSIIQRRRVVYRPFGEAPYLCLNKACSHFKKRVIKEVKITKCTSTSKLVGTFECSCGFIYSRSGPDIEESDIFKIGRVKAFGHVWQRQLEEYVLREGKSYRETARLLDVTPGTVKKYSKPSETPIHLEHDDKSKENEPYRQKWLVLRRENPGLSISEIRKLNVATYAYLYRHDKEWLDENSPAKKKAKKNNNRINWDERDKEVKREIQLVVSTLLKKKKPVRLTVSRIGKAINKSSLLVKKLHKMHLTKEYIETITESVDEFHIRKVHWAVEELKKQNTEVAKWRIIKLGCLPSSKVVLQEIEKMVTKNHYENP